MLEEYLDENANPNEPGPLVQRRVKRQQVSSDEEWMPPIDNHSDTLLTDDDGRGELDGRVPSGVAAACRRANQPAQKEKTIQEKGRAGLIRAIFGNFYKLIR